MTATTSTAPLLWVVEDSRTEAAIVCGILRPLYRVELFEDAESMLERFTQAEQRPDLVLIDWLLPGMSGVETCAFLRSRCDEVELPLVLVTVRSDASDVLQGLDAGANDYVHKPYQAPELLARIRTLVKVRQLHTRVDEARRELQERVEFERQLIGIVSHDLRNPLQVIALSAANLARPGPELSDKMRDGLTRVQATVSRCDRLIADLLDFTAIRGGTRLPVKLKPADLFALTRKVVDEHRLAEQDRAIEIETSGELTGDFDADRIEQMLGNLLGNALQHSPRGTAVTVSASGDGKQLTVSVRNAGEPIPEELQSKLFLPLQRGSSGGDGRRGIGLGLYIVREIVRGHGGEISVVSSAREGTVFIARWPRSVRGAPALSQLGA